jgi:hypothetical protein
LLHTQERLGPIKKADFLTLIMRAKGGKLTALLKSHAYGDTVIVEKNGEVSR